MLSSVKNKGEILIVLQDKHGAIFGGYMSQTVELRSEYFGTGESFLFKVTVGS